MKPLRNLTSEEFEQTISRLRMNSENIAIARKALVKGVPLSVLAKEVSKSKQTIEKAVKRV